MTRSSITIDDASSIIARARAPFPSSRRVYLEGEHHRDVRVPFREITISEGVAQGGQTLPRARFLVYDTSGPYTDPEIRIDVRKGLPHVRATWIDARDDTETYAGRVRRSEDDGYISQQAAARAAIQDPVERFVRTQAP